MHGCGPGPALVVNAEVDSMGGIVDGGAGIKTSPRRVAIEKAQAELRQEYDVREERRRELEFLEKGGNPLDFKIGRATSVSVQSTSLADPHADHFVTSEAKGSFALTASPHGDSVESSGRPSAPTICEPNSADNFHGENELLECERNPKHFNRRNNIAPSEQSSQIDGTQNVKELEDSGIVHSYARRNRSRKHRDCTRSSSTDIVHSSGNHGSSFPIRRGSRDTKGLISETNIHKEQNIPSASNLKPTNSNGDVISQVEISEKQSNGELDVVPALETKLDLPTGCLREDRLDVTESNISRIDKHNSISEVDTRKICVDMASGEHDDVGRKGQVIADVTGSPPCAAIAKTENEIGLLHLNGFIDLRRDGNEVQNSVAGAQAKGLDSEFSSTEQSLSLNVNNESELSLMQRNDNSNGIPIKKTSEFEGSQSLVADKMENINNEVQAIKSCTAINDDQISVQQNYICGESLVTAEEEMQRSSDLPNEVKLSNSSGVEQNNHIQAVADEKLGNELDGNSNLNKEYLGEPQGSVDCSNQQIPESALTEKNSCAVPEPQSCSSSPLKLADKAREDSVLEEARIIEAKHKRIAELSVGIIPSETRRKSHWDFVLEEMAWLANDFAQERLWKMTAAAQICRQVAFASWGRVREDYRHCGLEKVSHCLVKAVMQFWHSIDLSITSDDQSIGIKNCKDSSKRFDGSESSRVKFEEHDQNKSKELGTLGQNLLLPIQRYAIRFLKYNNFSVQSLQAEAPATPDRVADLGIMDVSWDDRLTEESLFYAVPSGAMETYRTSIESHLIQCEKTGSSIQEEVDTSICDAAGDFGYRETAYDEEEGETATYYLHGVFDSSKSTKQDQKKRKILVKSHPAKSYDLGADLPYGHSTVCPQQNMLMGKRPGNNLNVGPIPPKRMRTAPRQRPVNPFSAGHPGALQTAVKTDASSGDTSSFQDDQSTMHGGPQTQNSIEVESIGEFEKQLPYDFAETSTKSKKKKKAKNLGWQLDSTVHNELRDNTKKRLGSHQFEFNGSSGLDGLHAAKKPKTMNQSLDNTYDNMGTMTGSIPSPATSQMSNMSYTNRLIKLIGPRGKKAKLLKVSGGQLGSGSPWSPFEDQALVVLVHDMGPNWELISDAINSALQFKCIFRKAKECKERHKILMDKGAGDGADSAEDSGSSQSYPSTLPGIPKGSARQLFQRLQEPMEEDMLKSHFEKIIMIGKKQHYMSRQYDNQDPKQMAAVHNSHMFALSQVCPNNLNEGVLTPLDLCDVTASSPDILSLGYQSSHVNGLTMPNQGVAASMIPASGANSTVHGSSGTVVGNSSIQCGPLSALCRDGRYNAPRASLPVDEQQKMQHYNQMLSSRKLPVSGSISGAERGIHMLPGGNGMGMMPGINRSMPISRPGFQGMNSSSMLNSGSMLSSSVAGIQSHVGMHSGTGSVQGNSIMRPHEALRMMRPGHNPEHQRQMMVPELQIQVTQGTSQGIPAFNGLSSAFPNQTTPSAQTYQGHRQHHQISPQQSHVLSTPHHPHLQGPNHTTGLQQQAYAVHLAKERQMQQRLLKQQQQQQFASSSGLMPHVQPQPQIPISSSMQNSPQVQQQTSLQQTVSLPPLTSPSPMTPMSVQQQQQKHNLPHHGVSRNSQTGGSGLTNQVGKQRQRQQQQFQQSGRQHPQQRQHSQSPQQAKLIKGMGRGNMMAHQNLLIDQSPPNGLSVPPGNQGAEKGEQIMHLIQGQSLYPGTGLSPIQPSNSLVPPQSSSHSQPQQKLFPGSTPQSSRQLQQMPSHSDSTQGQVPLVTSVNTLAATHQGVPPALMGANHQHLQPHSQTNPHQKQVSQAQPNSQRVVQQNHQVNSDLPMKTQTDQAHMEQQPVNNISQMGINTASGIPQACHDSANAGPVVSSAVALQWKPSEPLHDPGRPNSASQASSIGSPPIITSAGNEPVVSVTQGLDQRQLSGSLVQHGHNATAQWQQQPLHPSTPPPHPSQQLFQPQEHQSQQEQQSPQQTQQQTQHFQTVKGSLYMSPSN
uniref:Chromatin modification-related protein EAF1 B-like n=1 Tax=Rhizophora mucronata TaxID=61149 RepID=A0A2P2MU04_RHIMU